MQIASKIELNEETTERNILSCSEEEKLKSEDDHQKKTFQKEKEMFSKKYQCDKCDKKYTWYSGLANHKRFVHNKVKEGKEM